MKEFLETLGKKIAETAEVVGKKTGDVVDTVTQKTGEIVEEQKMKSQIRTLTKGNNRDFADMGKMIYEQFKNGEVVDMQFVELCEAIEKRDEAIEVFKKQIAELKDLDICPNCQANLEKGAVYCSKCGKPLYEAEDVVDEDEFEEDNE